MFEKTYEIKPAPPVPTEQFVMDEFCSRGKESIRRRNLRASKSKPFDFIRSRKLIETNADDLWAVMKAGGAFTNHYLRCLHSSAIGYGWLLGPIIPPKLWPKAAKRPKRAITPAEHQKIVENENNEERRHYYELLWEIGAAQTDGANLTARTLNGINARSRIDGRRPANCAFCKTGNEQRRQSRQRIRRRYESDFSSY